MYTFHKLCLTTALKTTIQQEGGKHSPPFNVILQLSRTSFAKPRVRDRRSPDIDTCKLAQPYEASSRSNAHGCCSPFQAGFTVHYGIG